jgi:predicted enzyme related to lactoylglutathione lyase
LLLAGCHGSIDHDPGGTPTLEKVFYTSVLVSDEELQSRGVEFVSDVLEFPWDYVAQFQDPDGNRLQLRDGR